MPDWIQVEIGDEEKVRKATIRGAEVDLFVSPYDVPDAVRGSYSSDEKIFSLEFRYVGDESIKEVAGEHVTYHIGSFSSRLYGLDLDVRALGIESIDLSVALHEGEGQELAAKIRDSVTGAIDELIQRSPLAKLKEDNYRLAKDAVLATQDKLFAAA